MERVEAEIQRLSTNLETLRIEDLVIGLPNFDASAKSTIE